MNFNVTIEKRGDPILNSSKLSIQQNNGNVVNSVSDMFGNMSIKDLSNKPTIMENHLSKNDNNNFNDNNNQFNNNPFNNNGFNKNIHVNPMIPINGSNPFPLKQDINHLNMNINTNNNNNNNNMHNLMNHAKFPSFAISDIKHLNNNNNNNNNNVSNTNTNKMIPLNMTKQKADVQQMQQQLQQKIEEMQMQMQMQQILIEQQMNGYNNKTKDNHNNFMNNIMNNNVINNKDNNTKLSDNHAGETAAAEVKEEEEVFDVLQFSRIQLGNRAPRIPPPPPPPPQCMQQHNIQMGNLPPQMLIPHNIQMGNIPPQIPSLSSNLPKAPKRSMSHAHPQHREKGRMKPIVSYIGGRVYSIPDIHSVKNSLFPAASSGLDFAQSNYRRKRQLKTSGLKRSTTTFLPRGNRQRRQQRPQLKKPNSMNNMKVNQNPSIALPKKRLSISSKLLKKRSASCGVLTVVAELPE